MKTTPILLAAAIALMLALPGPAGAQGGGTQTGENGDCLDYNALYLVPGADSPLAATVTVTPGAGFTVTSAEGPAYIDFRDDAGSDLGFAAGSGVVPAGATYGIICVGLDLGYPEAPAPLATWTYQE